MDKATVIALAREVGLWEMLEGYSSEYGSLDAEEDCLPNLQRFAALVAAHERERCAKVCDNLSIDRGMFHPDDEMFKEGILGGARMCAVTIRSRT